DSQGTSPSWFRPGRADGFPCPPPRRPRAPSPADRCVSTRRWLRRPMTGALRRSLVDDQVRTLEFAQFVDEFGRHLGLQAGALGAVLFVFDGAQGVDLRDQVAAFIGDE